jgi:hypothetical protein
MILIQFTPVLTGDINFVVVNNSGYSISENYHLLPS